MDAGSSSGYMAGLIVGALCAAGVPFLVCILCIIWAAMTRAPGRRVVAIVVACFCGVVTLVAAVGGFITIAKKVQMQKYGARPAESGKVQEVAQYGYRFTFPGEPWVQIDAAKLNSLASLALMRTRPERFLMVIAENIDGEMDPQMVAEVAKGNLKSGAKDASIGPDRQETINGVTGIWFESRATLGAEHLSYVHWVLTTEGHVYQLIVWTRTSEAADLAAEARTVFAGFAPLPAEEEQ